MQQRYPEIMLRTWAKNCRVQSLRWAYRQETRDRVSRKHQEYLR